MTIPPPLRLRTECLFSKWGFWDGDVLLDYLYDNAAGIDNDDAYHRIADVDEHTVLRKLVRAHLLPALAHGGHDVEAYDIETNHNPIRASRVDGVDVDREVEYGAVDPPRLRPEHVDVPFDVVLRAAGLEVVPGEVVESAGS